MEETSVRFGSYLVACGGTLQSPFLCATVAVCLIDATSRVGGIAHITDSSPTTTRSALAALSSEICRAGGDRGNLTAAVCGAADPLDTRDDRFFVGRRIHVAITRELSSRGILQIEEDIGGSLGRRATLDLDRARVRVDDAAGGNTVLLAFSSRAKEPKDIGAPDGTT